MNRRHFLRTGVGLAAWAAVDRSLAARPDQADQGQVMTVQGPLPADQLGVTLPHEHVLVDFVGADKVSPQRYDADEVFQVMLPYLEQAREAGCQSLAECTPAYLGRDPQLLKRLAEASGVRLLTNTGYYGAVKNKYLPEHARQESAEQLAARWVAEWREGIEGTGIRPGFIKIGVDAGPLSELHRKLVQAAARTHRQTGLTIAVHSGDGQAALDQLTTLQQEQIEPQAWIWVHAQNEQDQQIHLQVARRGGWVELDGVRPDTIPQHVALVLNLHRHDLLHRTLVSQDAGWYRVGEPRGGPTRPYHRLLTDFVPALKKAGLNEQQVHQLLVLNPRQALTVRVRAQQ